MMSWTTGRTASYRRPGADHSGAARRRLRARPRARADRGHRRAERLRAAAGAAPGARGRRGEGRRLGHVAAVVAVCALSDLALITAGVLGAGAALTRMPWLLAVVCWVGAAFLLGYGLLAARRALRPGALRPDAAGARTGLAGDRRQLHGADLAQS